MNGRMFSISSIEAKLNLRLVTGEFEIISRLFRHGPTRSRELSMCTKVSLANFQIILRRLKDDNIVVSIPDKNDRRVRLFDLASHVRAECEAWGQGCAGASGKPLPGNSHNGSAVLQPSSSDLDARRD